MKSDSDFSCPDKIDKTIITEGQYHPFQLKIAFKMVVSHIKSKLVGKIAIFK